MILKNIKNFVLILTLASCTSHQKLAETKVNSEQKPPISLCFKLIVENKFEEFKNHFSECKTYRNPKGLTTLMMAIAKDNNDIAEYLIEQKVDVNEPDDAGFTALTFAANKNNARLAQVLRRNGAKIEVSQQNLSSLMMAVRNSSLELIQVLKPTKDEVNLRAEDGWTAIYFSISRQDKDILEFLLSHHACTRMKDQYKQTPLDFAKEIKWTEGIRILKKHKGSC